MHLDIQGTGTSTPRIVLNGQYNGECFPVNQKDLFVNCGKVVGRHRILEVMCYCQYCWTLI